MSNLANFTYNNLKISLIKHDAIKITNGDKNIYFDAFRLLETKKDADVIFITHDHFDHFSIEDIEKISKAGTVIVYPQTIENKVKIGLDTLQDIEFYPIIIGKEFFLENINLKFMAIPAYNINKFRAPNVPYHPRESGYVGYVVNWEGVRFYVAGDTDFIQEMRLLENMVDIAFLPISGKYVMTIEEAIEAALAIKPKIVVPMHYGEIVGDKDMGKKFAEKLAKKDSTIKVMVGS